MDNYYLQQILGVLNRLYSLFEPMVNNIEYILYSVLFFGFLFFAFQFISKRWLTL